MSKVATCYEIYKKIKGVPYPGQSWECGPGLKGWTTEKMAREVLSSVYGDDPLFSVVKITIQRLD